MESPKFSQGEPMKDIASKSSSPGEYEAAQAKLKEFLAKRGIKAQKDEPEELMNASPAEAPLPAKKKVLREVNLSSRPPIGGAQADRDDDEMVRNDAGEWVNKQYQ